MLRFITACDSKTAVGVAGGKPAHCWRCTHTNSWQQTDTPPALFGKAPAL
jgi:hypothetical protein